MDSVRGFEWHRCIVMNVSNSPEGYFERHFNRDKQGNRLTSCHVTVHLIDWGYKEYTTPKDLRFIPQSALQYPAAAFHAVFKSKVADMVSKCNWEKCELYPKTVEYFGSNSEKSTLVNFKIRHMTHTNCILPTKVKIYADAVNLEKLNLEPFREYYYNSIYRSHRLLHQCKQN